MTKPKKDCGCEANVSFLIGRLMDAWGETDGYNISKDMDLALSSLETYLKLKVNHAEN